MQADAWWIYFVMWVTAGLELLVFGVFLWGTAGAVVDMRQAKRLFPFGAGGILRPQTRRLTPPQRPVR
jgi:hypothetical protein